MFYNRKKLTRVWTTCIALHCHRGHAIGGCEKNEDSIAHLICLLRGSCIECLDISVRAEGCNIGHWKDAVRCPPVVLIQPRTGNPKQQFSATVWVSQTLSNLAPASGLSSLTAWSCWVAGVFRCVFRWICGQPCEPTLGFSFDCKETAAIHCTERPGYHSRPIACVSTFLKDLIISGE